MEPSKNLKRIQKSSLPKRHLLTDGTDQSKLEHVNLNITTTSDAVSKQSYKGDRESRTIRKGRYP